MPLEKPVTPVPGPRRVLADFGGIYAASALIAFLFAASGPVAILLSVALAACTLLAALYGGPDTGAFLGSTAMCALAGFLCYQRTSLERDLTIREGYAVVSIAWLEQFLCGFAGCAVVITHDRMFLDRLATHILAFEGDSHVEWFEGNFEDYEEDKKRRLGEDAVMPRRIKYKQFARA